MRIVRQRGGLLFEGARQQKGRKEGKERKKNKKRKKRKKKETMMMA